MNTIRIDRLVSEVARLTAEEVVEFQARLALRTGRQDPPPEPAPVVAPPKRPSGSGPKSGAATVEKSGAASTSVQTASPSVACPSCGTTRRNLCKWEADVKMERPTTPERPPGCLTA